jgi:hypothetical protein
MKKKDRFLVPIAGLVLAAGLVMGVVGIAHADTTSTQPTGAQHGTPPAAFGKVTAVNGDDITITAQGKNSTTGTTYTVDATNATITKRTAPTTQGAKPTSTTITVSQVAVGDMLSVQGTVSGTTITATSINDGQGGFGGGRGGMMGGRGQGVMGTVTAVNGSTLTVTGKDGTTYTVDASNANLTKMETITVSDVQVGDTVGVQGTVSGDSVTAKSVMDGIPTPPQNGGGTGTASS